MLNKFFDPSTPSKRNVDDGETRKTRDKLWLSCAKLNISYVEAKVEVVIKVKEEVVVEARDQLLFRQVVGGWWVVG